MFEHQISAEAVERLEVWVLAHCPAALENPQFLPGLVVIIAEEVSLQVRQRCWKQLRHLTEPCKH